MLRGDGQRGQTRITVTTMTPRFLVTFVEAMVVEAYSDNLYRLISYKYLINIFVIAFNLSFYYVVPLPLKRPRMGSINSIHLSINLSSYHLFSASSDFEADPFCILKSAEIGPTSVMRSTISYW